MQWSERLGVFQKPADIFKRQLAFENPETFKQRKIGLTRGLNRLGLHGARPRRQEEQLRPLVGWMRPALDQPVADHARKRIGHGRLLDIESLEKLFLGQPVLGPEFQQNGELARRKTEPDRALVQRAGKTLRQLAGKVGSLF